MLSARTIALLLFCLLDAVTAQSRVSQAVTAYLSNSTSLSGAAAKLAPFNLQIIANETSAVITFNLTKTAVKNVGWLAFGTGTRMANSDIFVAWPTISSRNVSWTFSQRTAGGHMLPEANIQQPSKELVLLPKLTTLISGDTPYTLLSFLRPLNPIYQTDAESNELGKIPSSIIYAYSSANPDSTKVDAPFTVHDQYGAIEMDLSKAVRGTVISPSATATNSSDTSPDDGSDLTPENAEEVKQPWSRTDDIVVIHALAGTLAWLVVSPSAILLARMGRDYSGWLNIHKFLQVGLTTSLTLVSFILGVVITGRYSLPHFKCTHQALGLALLLLLLLQVGLGFYIHHLFDAKRLKRPVRNLLHILLGLSSTLVGFLTIWQGFQEYIERGRLTPVYIKVIYWIAIGIFSSLLILSSLRLVWRRRQQGLPLKDAALGIGRLTKNNAVQPSLYQAQHPLASNFSLDEFKGASGWQNFDNREKSQF